MIPKSVKIGAQTFDIFERTKKQDTFLAEGNYGYTRDEAYELPVRPKDKASFDDWEHYFIGIYETSLLMIMKENPGLLKWLTKEN